MPGNLVIAQTKCSVPTSLHAFIPRPRLYDVLKRLDSLMASGVLTLLSAPAGSGKTSLLSQWASTILAPRRVAWVSLDEFDNKVRRFWRCLLALDGCVAALQPSLLFLIHHYIFLRTS